MQIQNKPNPNGDNANFQQNVKALPTPPLAEPENPQRGVAAELGAAPCSASFCSENRQLEELCKREFQQYYRENKASSE